MRMRMRMRKKINKKKSLFLLIKMESQKIINLLEKTSDNKDLSKERINKKKYIIITKKLRWTNQ